LSIKSTAFNKEKKKPGEFGKRKRVLKI